MVTPLPPKNAAAHEMPACNTHVPPDDGPARPANGLPTVQATYRDCLARLAQAGIPDAAFEARTLLEHVAGRSRFELDALTPEQQEALETLIVRRIRREPLQYLLGTWPFMDLELAVGPGVLIPRPETEQVCLAALEKLAGNPAPTVLELCAGTGAMALAIQSRLPEAMVTAVEMDDKAFYWLEQNVRRFACAQGPHPDSKGNKPPHGVSSRPDLERGRGGSTHTCSTGDKTGDNMTQSYTQVPQPVQADALVYHSTLPPAGLDLIVCNPPYVDAADYDALDPELYFEPRQALVAPEQGYFFYRHIARDYRETLKPGGWLVFELGAGQGPAVREILAQNGYTAIDIRPDYAGHDRIALAQRPANSTEL